MGSALLVDPGDPTRLILPLFAGCVLAWCVADGDLALLPRSRSGARSFAAQTHLSVVYLGPGLLRRRRGVGLDPRSDRAGTRWIAVAVLVAGRALGSRRSSSSSRRPVGNMTRLVDEAQNPPGGLIGPRNARACDGGRRRVAAVLVP